MAKLPSRGERKMHPALISSVVQLPVSDPANEAFRKVIMVDSTVSKVIRAGGTLEDCIVALHEQKQEMTERMIVLEAIAPKKIRTPDGVEHIWRCPDDLVPVVDCKPGTPSDESSNRPPK